MSDNEFRMLVESLIEMIEDIIDVKAAIAAIAEIEQGARIYSQEEVMKELGIDMDDLEIEP